MTILASASLSLLVKEMERLGIARSIATRDWMVLEYTTGLDRDHKTKHRMATRDWMVLEYTTGLDRDHKTKHRMATRDWMVLAYSNGPG